MKTGERGRVGCLNRPCRRVGQGSRRSAAILAAPLVLLFALPAQALTEAEQAAVSERPLTPEEAGRRARDCTPSIAPLLGAFQDLEVGIAEWSEMRILKAIAMTHGVGAEGKSQISAFEPLPNGGIGGRDFCDTVQVIVYPPPPEGEPSEYIGLRLRPGLDLASDYPTAFAEIEQRGQLLDIDARSFVAVKLTDANEAPEALPRVTNSDLVPPEGYAVVVGRRLLVPLAR